MGKQFAGKSVIVTGAASGIGKAAAYRWAEEGAKVCIADMDIPRAAFINGTAQVVDGGLTSSFAAVRYEKAD